MRQILQNLRSGALALEEVPPPALTPGGVRVRTVASLISAGTEKQAMDLASRTLLGKARARPDLLRQVLAKAQRDGWVNALQTSFDRLERPQALGYSAAGVVIEVGSAVGDLAPGDRVAIAGAGYANHAEENVVPRNLVARVPEGVRFEDAAYATVASIALQGVRLAEPALGDLVVVHGLGLIGLLAAQILGANGCRVLGVDLDPRKAALALELGVEAAVAASSEDPVEAVQRWSGGRGADHVLIAAATDSHQPVEQAGAFARRKGQVVAIGAVGMQIPRDVYYAKELTFKISMSYGPGRYDATYEEGGVDYPYDYVRWTEQRNLEAVLGLIRTGRLDVARLTTHRIPLDRALDAYEMIRTGSEAYVGVVLDYPGAAPRETSVAVRAERAADRARDVLRVGFVGAGNYATAQLLPHLRGRADVALRSLVTATGFSARQKAEKFGFLRCGTELAALLEDAELDAVFVATRHATHAEYAVRSLAAGKHVFVEKPMVVDETQLADIARAYAAANEARPVGLMVGLNRRFAPLVGELRAAFPAGAPKQMLYRVNSGAIPTGGWLHAPEEGGGMLVGEMCHFLDLMQSLAGDRPETVYAQRVRVGDAGVGAEDNLTIVVGFAGGSVGTLCYGTLGDKGLAKERLEVFGAGRAAVLDDFRALELAKDGRVRRVRGRSQDKGQRAQIEACVASFRTRGAAPIPFDELMDAMRMVFAARRSLAEGRRVDVADVAPAYSR